MHERDSFLWSSAVKQSHALVASTIKEGDTAVDATAGNGYDSLFLAQCVGEKGRVVAFDVQDDAIDSTRGRLEAAGVRARVELVRASHDSIDAYVHGDVAAVMFNLGYLPGSDRVVTTHAETTTRAINIAMSLLRPNGVITIVAYTGHPGGREEVDSVLRFIEQVNADHFDARIIRCLNRTGDPPFLVAVRRRQ